MGIGNSRTFAFLISSSNSSLSQSSDPSHTTLVPYIFTLVSSFSSSLSLSLALRLSLSISHSLSLLQDTLLRKMGCKSTPETRSSLCSDVYKGGKAWPRSNLSPNKFEPLDYGEVMDVPFAPSPSRFILSLSPLPRSRFPFSNTDTYTFTFSLGLANALSRFCSSHYFRNAQASSCSKSFSMQGLPFALILLGRLPLFQVSSFSAFSLAESRPRDIYRLKIVWSPFKCLSAKSD